MYLFYWMYLQEKEDSELTGLETVMKEQMKNQSITYFPIYKALALPEEEEEDEEIQGLKESVNQLNTKIEELQRKLEANGTAADEKGPGEA